MSRQSEKPTGNGPRSKTNKRQHSLESLEVYEVEEKAPEADLDAAETILARLLVDEWLRTRGESTTEADIGRLAPNEADLQKDDCGS